MELSAELLIRLLEVIDFRFGLRHRLQQSRVGLLTGEEFTHHFLHVGYLSCGFDVFEGFIDLGGVAHLLLHTLAHVGVPELLGVEVLTHFEFRAVFILVSGGFSNFCVLALTLDSARHRRFFVLDAFLEFENTFLSVFLFELDILHQVVEDSFRLETLLFSFTLLTRFKLQNTLLRLDTAVEFR